jgi:hypothetical protein
MTAEILACTGRVDDGRGETAELFFSLVDDDLGVGAVEL